MKTIAELLKIRDELQSLLQSIPVNSATYTTRSRLTDSIDEINKLIGQQTYN